LNPSSAPDCNAIGNAYYIPELVACLPFMWSVYK